MARLSSWSCAYGVVLALAGAAGALGAGTPMTGASTSPSANGGPATPPRAVPWCRAGQVVVGGTGSSTAAGTVILAVRVTDISPQRCALRGWPGGSFIGQGGEPLAVALSHDGTGAAFASPETVVMVPPSAPTSGFVVAFTATSPSPGG